MSDFDLNTVKFRSHCIYDILTKPKEKSKEQMLYELECQIKDEQEKLKEIREGLKSRETKIQKISDLTAKYQAVKMLPDRILLSTTAQKQALKMYALAKFGRRGIPISGAALEKGTKAEEDSVTMLSEYFGRYLKTNKENKVNDFITGRCDIVEGEIITDVKTSWDINTFNASVNDGISATYFWQLQSYLELWDKPIGRIAYCIPNATMELMDYKVKLMKFDADPSEWEEKEMQIYKEMSFNDMDLQDKIHIFEFERIPNFGEIVYPEVIKCREFLKEFTKKPLIEKIDFNTFLN